MRQYSIRTANVSSHERLALRLLSAWVWFLLATFLTVCQVGTVAEKFDRSVDTLSAPDVNPDLVVATPHESRLSGSSEAPPLIFVAAAPPTACPTSRPLPKHGSASFAPSAEYPTFSLPRPPPLA